MQGWIYKRSGIRCNGRIAAWGKDMNTLAYIEGLRDKYLAAMRREIQQRREKGDLLGVEVAARPNGPPGHPANVKIIRFDLMTGTSESPQPSILMGEAAEGPQVGALQAGEIEVAIFPFLWEACRIWLRHKDPDWSGLSAWYDRWMDLEGKKDSDEDGLSGVVHFCSEPLAEGGGYLVELDFGSAPAEAFTDLLKVLSQMGASEVHVGLSDGSDMDVEIAGELKQPGLTPAGFTRLVADLLGELDEVETVEIPEPLVLRVKAPGVDEPFLSNLHNLWLLVQRTEIEKRPREVGRFIRGHRESHQIRESGTKPDLSSLRPVIKPSGFIDQIRQFAMDRAKETKVGGVKTSALSLVCRHLVADLWVACVWDRPNGMQFVTGSEPEEFGLSHEEVLERALANFLEARPAVELTKQDGVTLARTQDNYDASLLLDDAFWTQVQEEMPGALLSCVPTRDMVLITSTETPGGERALRVLASEFASSANHAISTTVLRREGGKWEVHTPTPDAQIPPPVRVQMPAEMPEPVKRKRPWWKFWGKR